MVQNLKVPRLIDIDLVKAQTQHELKIEGNFKNIYFKAILKFP